MLVDLSSKVEPQLSVYQNVISNLLKDSENLLHKNNKIVSHLNVHTANQLLVCMIGNVKLAAMRTSITKLSDLRTLMRMNGFATSVEV